MYIQVYNNGTKSPVTNCEITLYSSYSNWNNYTNALCSGTTNDDGKILFYNLDNIEYYIYAYKSITQNRFLHNRQLTYIIPKLSTSYSIPTYAVYVAEYVNYKNGQKGYKIVDVKPIEENSNEIYAELQK